MGLDKAAGTRTTGDREMQRQAAEIAKATGIDAFGHDSIGAVMYKYDKNGDGVFSVSEVREIVHDVVAQRSLNKQLKKFLLLMFFIVIIVVGALVGSSVTGAVIGGESIKEAKVPDCSKGDDPRCDPGNVVHTAPVESFVSSIFDLPAVPTEQLAYLRDVTMYVDMSAAAVGGAVEATFKLAGAYKRSDTQAYLVTANGYTIELDGANKVGSIEMDGAKYPVSEEPPTAGRKLETTPFAPMAATKSGRQLAEHHEQRRELYFGGSLMTSGSFTMHATGGMTGGRRELTGGRRELYFGGSLRSSGSFTMMATTGFGGGRRL